MNYYCFQKLKFTFHNLKNLNFFYCKTYLRSYDHSGMKEGIIIRPVAEHKVSRLWPVPPKPIHKTTHKKVLSRDLNTFKFVANVFFTVKVDG